MWIIQLPARNRFRLIVKLERGNSIIFLAPIYGKCPTNNFLRWTIMIESTSFSFATLYICVWHSHDMCKLDQAILYCLEKSPTKSTFIRSKVTEYEGVTKSIRTGRQERELQKVELSATRCSCIAILWVSIGSFVAITLLFASQRVFIVVSLYFIIDSVRKLLDTPLYNTVTSNILQLCRILFCFLFDVHKITYLSFNCSVWESVRNFEQHWCHLFHNTTQLAAFIWIFLWMWIMNGGQY
jgi:hypothetical protein